MKIKDGFVLTEVGDDYIAVPVGEASESFHGIIRLNDTGSFIWRTLSEGLTTEQIIDKLLEEYDTDRETAERAVNDMVHRLKADGLLEE